MADWREERVQELATGKAFRVVERYSIPTKGTGFIMVTEGRRCFHAIGQNRRPLGLLPADISPEDRLSVLEWAIAEMQRQTKARVQHAKDGTKAPHPFSKEAKGK